MVWPHPRDVILCARSSYYYDNMFIICLFSDNLSDFITCSRKNAGTFALKGTATLMISMFYQKELYEP